MTCLKGIHILQALTLHLEDYCLSVREIYTPRNELKKSSLPLTEQMWLMLIHFIVLEQPLLIWLSVGENCTSTVTSHRPSRSTSPCTNTPGQTLHYSTLADSHQGIFISPSYCPPCQRANEVAYWQEVLRHTTIQLHCRSCLENHSLWRGVCTTSQQFLNVLQIQTAAPALCLIPLLWYALCQLSLEWPLIIMEPPGFNVLLSDCVFTCVFQLCP